MQWDGWFVPMAVSALLGFAVGVLAWRRGRHMAGGKAFVVVAAGVGIWSGAYAMQWLSRSLGAQLAWEKAIYFGVVLVPAGFLVAALYFSGRERLITEVLISLLCVEPVLAIVAAWVNPGHLFIVSAHLTSRYPHALVWKQGVLFDIHSVYSYLVIFIGVALFTSGWRHASGPFRAQMRLVVASCLIPFATSIFNVTFRAAHPAAPDPTPVAFTATTAIIFWALYRHQLLDLVSVSRNVVIDTMSDAVLVLDTAGRVVDVNAAGETLLREVDSSLPSQLVGLDADTVMGAWPLPPELADGAVSQVSLQTPAGLRHLDVRCTALNSRSGVCTGQVLVIRDETELVEAERHLEAANAELRDRVSTIEMLKAELEEMAVRDPLTGLFNRRHMDHIVGRELARGIREGYPVTIALIDIDEFKALNDTLGHGAGDDVLAQVGKLLLANVRASDACFRYGGDELLVLMPNITSQQAVLRAEQWREACSHLRIANARRQVTISVGIASAPDDGFDTTSLAAAADAALYRAKHAGRNRVFSKVGAL